MKIYIESTKREPKDTLYTFLRKVLNLDNNFHTGSIIENTYSDPEFKELQCKKLKHRSFDDLVSISKTYFKVSDKTVAKTILKFLKENDKLIFVLCDSAKKWVLNHGLTKSTLLYCGIYDMSYNKTAFKKEGIYCLDDIFNLMGIDKTYIDPDYDDDDDD